VELYRAFGSSVDAHKAVLAAHPMYANLMERALAKVVLQHVTTLEKFCQVLHLATKKRKERFTLFSDHNRSLQRRQPRVHLAAACVNIACCCKSCTVLMMTGCHECLVAYHPPGTHEFLTSVVSAQSHKYLWIPTLPKVHGMAISSR